MRKEPGPVADDGDLDQAEGTTIDDRQGTEGTVGLLHGEAEVKDPSVVRHPAMDRDPPRGRGTGELRPGVLHGHRAMLLGGGPC